MKGAMTDSQASWALTALVRRDMVTMIMMTFRLLITVGVMFLFSSGACHRAIAAEAADVRRPAVAGTFYPVDSTELAGIVKAHLAKARGIPSVDGRIVALIVPHAGLAYSGEIAATAYHLLRGRDIRTVILCGPAHRYDFEGLAIYGPGVAWKSPLGLVHCADELCRYLVDFDENIVADVKAHRSEHSLEVQLPYLQTVLSDFEIVPVTVGRQTTSSMQMAARALSSIEMDKHTIMVASTDWQHYRPASVGWKMDSLGIDCLDRLDPDRLARLLQSGRVEACGGGATVAVVKAALAQGANRIRILRYGDSGETSGDTSSVVSYVAAVIYEAAAPQVGPDLGKVTVPRDYEKDQYNWPDADRTDLASHRATSTQ
jgi:AmmeMemoRadiSam system protein B